MISVAFSPDGALIVSGGCDNTVKLWSVENGACLKTLNGHSYFVTSVVFSPDGQYIASGSNDYTIKFWCVKSGECVRTIDNVAGNSTEGHREQVYTVAFSPDGQYLASSGNDCTVKLWNTPAREISLQARERMYALLAGLKYGGFGQSVYQLGQHGGGVFPMIQAMVSWLDLEWKVA